MAAMEFSQNALVLKYEVESGQSVTIGEGVVLASDTTVQDAGAASDLAVGVAVATTSAGNLAEIMMYGFAVVPCTVGTTGATRGKKALLEATGHCDATAHDSDGTGNQSTYGVFLQSGTSGQRVGLLLSGAANRGV